MHRPIMLALACHTVVGSWLIFCDGSLSLTGMGIGVIIGRTAEFPPVQVSVPVLAADATGMEALDPAC